MDLALQEMKSFLRKLECKQAHIELDNLKIQKNINTLRESLEGVKEIKDKIEQMSRNNLEQEKLIKDLKVQIIKLKKKQKNEALNTDSYVKDFNKALELDIPPRCYDKKASHLMKVLESNLFVPEADSEYTETYKRKEGKKEIENSYRNSYSTIKSDHSDYSYVFHTVDEEILERYLKDAAAFHDDAMTDEDNDRSEEIPPKESENSDSDGGNQFKTFPNENRSAHMKSTCQFRSSVESNDSMESKRTEPRGQNTKKKLFKKCRRKMTNRANHLDHCKSKSKTLKIFNSKHCSDHCSVREVFRNRKRR